MDFSKHTILIVDDESAFRKFLRKIIEKEFNANVVEAINPKEGFLYLNDNTPSLIILDMEMPVMDGFTALKRLRTMPDKRNIPVIACTALSSRELFLSLFDLKISDYIIKPSNSDAILAKIGRILNILE